MVWLIGKEGVDRLGYWVGLSYGLIDWQGGVDRLGYWVGLGKGLVSWQGALC